MFYCVIKEHIRSYDEPLCLKAGEVVNVGPRDIHWPLWLWCTNTLGVGGWVPEQLLDGVTGSRARVSREYRSIELTVGRGELLEGIELLEGWVWCQNDSEDEGWVPLENLEPVVD